MLEGDTLERWRSIPLSTRIERYVDKCPPAVSHNYGHTTTFKVAIALAVVFPSRHKESRVADKWQSSEKGFWPIFGLPNRTQIGSGDLICTRQGSKLSIFQNRHRCFSAGVIDEPGSLSESASLLSRRGRVKNLI